MKTKNKKRIDFKAYVRLGSGIDLVVVSFSMDMDPDKDEMSLVWDDVHDAACVAMEKRFSDKEFPKMDVERIEILADDGEWPVMSDEEYEKFEGPKPKKILVLPCYTYSLTPEYAAYLKLSEEGLVDFEFDVGKMKRLMELMGSAKDGKTA